jgi:hypothetical protein
LEGRRSWILMLVWWHGSRDWRRAKPESVAGAGERVWRRVVLVLGVLPLPALGLWFGPGVRAALAAGLTFVAPFWVAVATNLAVEAKVAGLPLLRCWRGERRATTAATPTAGLLMGCAVECCWIHCESLMRSRGRKRKIGTMLGDEERL